MTDKTEYYFIGIKGTGMAALACMLHDLGNTVSGSDLERHFFTEEPLHERHISIVPFDPANIRDHMHVIIGNAFLDDFPEVAAARSNSTCVCTRYHAFVGEFLKKYRTIAISGSHGKTTTTGMMAALFSHVAPTGWLIGDGNGHLSPDTFYFALEADEFQRHFLAYHPAYAIITNVDLDHVDYFRDKADYRLAYEEFSRQVTKGIFLWGEDEEGRKLHLNPNVSLVRYGEDERDDLQAVHIEEHSDGMAFDVLFHREPIGRFSLPFVGHHLLLNSLACIGVGLEEGLSRAQIEAGLSSFRGVKRRFVVKTIGENVYIDDYAHHPTEISVTIDTARRRFPGRKLVVIFKPHRASRVKYFADAFVQALAKADRVYLCPFTSIDDMQDGTNIDITYLQKRLPQSVVLSEDETGASILARERPAVFLFMSSKDIYGLEALIEAIPSV